MRSPIGIVWRGFNAAEGSKATGVHPTPRAPGNLSSMPNDEVKLAAAMAEFEALRAEILHIRGVQKNVVSIALATYAAVFSFALGQDGDSHILLVVPPLGLALCLLQLSEMLQIARLGRYIRDYVWAVIGKLTDYPHSWEARDNDRGLRRLTGAASLLDGAFPVLLCGGGGVFAMAAMPDVGRRLEAFGWTCVGLTGLFPAAVALMFIRDRDGNGGVCRRSDVA